MRKVKGYIYIYLALLVILIGLIAFLLWRIDYYNGLYAVHTSNINESGLCTLGTQEPTMLFFYGNDCKTCTATETGFINATARFGTWTGGSFVATAPYFCAYLFNITQYNQDPSGISAPLQSIGIFNNYSQGFVPLIVFGGKYYKIGGFANATLAYQEIFKYICLSINNVSSVCG